MAVKRALAKPLTAHIHPRHTQSILTDSGCLFCRPASPLKMRKLVHCVRCVSNSEEIQKKQKSHTHLSSLLALFYLRTEGVLVPTFMSQITLQKMYLKDGQWLLFLVIELR